MLTMLQTKVAEFCENSPEYVPQSQLTFPWYELKKAAERESSPIEEYFRVIREIFSQGTAVFIPQYRCAGRVVGEPVMEIDMVTGKQQVTVVVEWEEEDRVYIWGLPVAEIQPRELIIV